MFTLQCDIHIGKLRISQVNAVKVEKSWLTLADKASIKLPRAYEVLRNDIKVGDPVSITLGYEGVKDYQEFVGFVKRIKPGIPLEIVCEDPTWLMRKVQVEKSWEKSVTLKEMVKYIIDQVNKKAPAEAHKIKLNDTLPTISFSQYTLEPNNAAQAIEVLKKKFGLAVYFRGYELFAGVAYLPVKQNVSYEIGRNVIADQLTYRHEDDVRLSIRITSALKNNKFINIVDGDSDGEVRSLFFYNIEDEEALRQRARTEIQKYKYTGFEGNLTGFLIPYAEPNMTAILTDPDYPNLRNGSYVINAVTTTYGINGARRLVELGVQVGDTKNETQSS